MSLQRDFTAHELALLLRSEDGFQFIAALMADADPQWWRGVRKANALGAMRRQQKQLQEAISELEQVDGALARAEAALSVSDEDFHRPHVDALRAVTRVPNRPLAQRA